jgi:hypothetical protein
VGRHRQRVVEGRNRGHDAGREPEVVAHAVLGSLAAVERQRLASQPAAFIGRQAKDRRRPRRLAPCLANGLAAFPRDSPGVLVLRDVDAVRRAHEDVVSDVRRELVRERRFGGAHGGVDVPGRSGGDDGHPLAVERIPDLDVGRSP